MTIEQATINRLQVYTQNQNVIKRDIINSMKEAWVKEYYISISWIDRCHRRIVEKASKMRNIWKYNIAEEYIRDYRMRVNGRKEADAAATFWESTYF